MQMHIGIYHSEDGIVEYCFILNQLRFGKLTFKVKLVYYIKLRHCYCVLYLIDTLMY